LSGGIEAVALVVGFGGRSILKLGVIPAKAGTHLTARRQLKAGSLLSQGSIGGWAAGSCGS
jgi:hypothetical protein